MHRGTVLLIIGLSLLGLVGDYALKRAGEFPNLLLNRHFALGVSVYAASAIGWAYLLRSAKLATVGAIYSVIIVLGLAVMGIALFRESLSGPEYAGLGFAVAALVLLGRFA